MSEDGADPADKTKKTYHHGNLRAELIRGARHLLEEKGADALSLREVARAIGVSANAPYRHFADKEALVAAVAEKGFAAMTEQLQAVRGGSAEEQYVRVCRTYIGFALEHPALIRLMFGSCSGKFDVYPDLGRAARAALQELIRTVAACMNRSPEEEAHSEVFPYAIGVWSLLHGYATLRGEGALGFPGDMPLPTPEQLAHMICFPSSAAPIHEP